VTRSLFFITHPDVVSDPEVPVAEWPLSERGLLGAVRPKIDRP